VKPGKGPAFVRTKLKRVSDGAVIDKTFRAGEKFRAVRNEVRKMQFLYSDGTTAHMMDMENYEQLELPQELVADDLRWIKPNEEVDVLYVDGRAAPAAEGFRKVALEQGASERLTITLDRRAFSYWDQRTNRWRVGRGCYTLAVGGSSRSLPLATRVPIAGGHCSSKRGR
jgi:translation elongation factor P/translation initiation factor 5A